MTDKPELEVIWEPIPGTSQELAVDTRCHHTLYHGTRGPGKTITQLMRFRRHVGIGYGSFMRGAIFDKEFKNLSDLVAQSKRFFNAFDDGAKFHESASDYKWVWPTGEELLLRHAKKVSDYESYHGHEYPFIGWNELTKQPTAELYDKMMSTNRSSFVPEVHTPKARDSKGNVAKREDGSIIYETPDGKPLPPIPLEVFSTTNPSGPGHNWVRRRFINPAKNGEVVRTTCEVYDPKTKANVIVTKTQVAIFGSYRENIFLDAEYIAELNRLTANNPNLREAWLKGNWNVTAGGALDDLWDNKVHILPRFQVPKSWYVDRTMDWGSVHPFSVGLWAEANGEDVILENGEKLSIERDSLIQIDEWYGTQEIGSNKGIKLSATDVAAGIRDREVKLLSNNWIKKQPYPGPADTKKGGNTDTTEDSIDDKMAKVGIYWETPKKTPGSRIQGLQLIRDRLEASLRNEGPGLYFMANCISSIETLPPIPRDDAKIDDVDTTAEDHVYDMVRYRVLKGNNRVFSSGSYH
jgi:hypothetical protein